MMIDFYKNYFGIKINFLIKNLVNIGTNVNCSGQNQA